jgi:hypothetical protein
MRIALSLAIAFGLFARATDANAERRDCEVVFVRAPDEARLVIESWLKAEPRCSGTIELRVVETEGGSLYLIAQRPDGRIHEREVPDAQSAGVLVASWIADDWTSTPPDEDDEAAPSTVEAPTVNPVEGAPGVTAVAPPPRTQSRTTGRWFSVAGMIQTEGQGGVGARFEMDLVGGRSSKWTLGIMASGVSSQMATWDGVPMTLETVDLRALLVAARTWRLGQNWNIRWSIGLGPMYTDAVGTSWDASNMQHVTADGVSLAYESTLTIAREMFDHRWAIMAGPAVTMIQQELDGYEGDISRNKTELMFMLGARYRL